MTLLIRDNFWFENSQKCLRDETKFAFLQADKAPDIETFLSLVFPLRSPLGGVAGRILETGAEFEKASKICWAPRWSKIALTQKDGKDDCTISVKRTFYRIHDCLHQLWGIPTPKTYSEEERRYYKRCQMSGEIAVLALTEFCYGLLVKGAFPDLSPIIDDRLAVRIFPWEKIDREKLREITVWLNDELHENYHKPLPMTTNREFIADYRAMLQRDRDQIDHNWLLMKAVKWHPGKNAPKDMLPPGLCGLDLSLWMIDDFLRLLGTSPEIDWALREFNRNRRRQVILPEGWAS